MKGSSSIKTADIKTKVEARTDADATLEALQELCAELGPGSRIPTHKELMRRFQASERAVLRALSEMQRTGAIARRNGVGTFVALADAGNRAGRTAFATSRLDRAIIAVARPDNSFFDRCMEELHRYAEGAGLDLMCRLVGSGAEIIPAPEPENRPLGYVFFRYQLAPAAARLQENGCRVVVIGAPPADVTPEIPCVHGDHEQGGGLALRHLIALGHRRVVFAHPGEDLPLQLRWRGYQRVLRESATAGIAVETSLLLSRQTETWIETPALAAAYFRALNAPTALVCWNDHEAVRLLATLNRAGVRVPEDVSLVGYDALPEGKQTYPALTTVDHAIGQQLQAAIRFLTHPDSQPQRVILAPTLVQRESTAPPPNFERE